MWFLAAIALGLVGVGCYIMLFDWDKGVILVTFSILLLVLTIIPELLCRFGKNDRPD